MRALLWLTVLAPFVLLAHGASAAPPKKRSAQVSIATFKQPARQAARLPVRRTTHRAVGAQAANGRAG